MTDEQKALVRNVATDVMGWTLVGEDEEVYTDGYIHWFELDFGQCIDYTESDAFNPLTRYDSAGLVIGEMALKGWEFEKSSRGYVNGVSRVWFIQKDELGYLWKTTAGLGEWRQAMCEAALEAVRSEKR